jgi:hypothetical protein
VIDASTARFYMARRLSSTSLSLAADQSAGAARERDQSVQRELPFQVRKSQSDNGAEFPLAFRLEVEGRGMRYRYIAPRRPERNGKVEQESPRRQRGVVESPSCATLREAEAPLAAWERRHNHERFSLALEWRAPAAKLQLHLGSQAQPSITAAG